MNGREGNGHAIEKVPAGEHRITKGMDAREQVEQTADRIRDELLLTLEELDRRRERMLNVRYQAQQHRDLLVAAGATTAVLVGTGLGIAIYRARHREELLRRQRRKALQRAWEHPDQVAARRAKQPPLAAELGRKLVVIFVSALATAVARNAVVSLVPMSRSANPATAGQKNK